MPKMLKLLILAVAVCPLVTSFKVNFDEYEPWHNNNGSTFEKQPKKTATISLNDFSIFDLLGSGSFASVYIAKKNGGSDDGELYALKAINITHAIRMDKDFKSNSLKYEREVLEGVREFTGMTHLHYAFREGNWAFLVMDLTMGGMVGNMLNNMTNERARLILAEIVSALENLHKMNFLYADFHGCNILIDNQGHLVLSDFGLARPLHNQTNDTLSDWRSFFYFCYQVFSSPVRTDNEKSFLVLAENMTDATLPEVKNHPYFDGIDWEKVDKRELTPPFDSTEFELNEENLKDPENLFGTRNDNDLDANLSKQFHNYTFVSPKHWN